MNPISRWAIALIIAGVSLTVGCSRPAKQQPDSPRLTANVRMVDVVFYSAALQRNMSYRVILPKRMAAAAKLPVVYLLHGGDGSFRDWSNYSDIAKFAERQFILVMPQGDSSYYTNAVNRPEDRYEDYIVNDLIADVESRFPAVRGRSARAIVGVSMGGFGAVKIALKHPELFAFSGGISSAIDVPTRAFSIKRVSQWRGHRAIFGDWQGTGQRENDPYLLAASVNPANAPYFYLSCGDKEGLLPANRRFAELLSKRRFRYEFHVASGGHDWVQWNKQIPDCFERLLDELNSAARAQALPSES